MATFSSPQFTTSAPTPTEAGFAAQIVDLRFVISVTAAVTTADVFNFGYAPKGFRVLGGYLKASDMDTGGSPSLTINVGDAADADRLFAASTAGQAGTATQLSVATGVGYQYTDRTLITGAPAANPATGAAGTLELVLWGVIEGTAS
jgi:hypothetical protein